MLEKVFVALGIGGILALIIGFFIIGPIISIWAVNQLFNAAIALNFWNWVAVAWLHLVVASTTTTSKS